MTKVTLKGALADRAKMSSGSGLILPRIKTHMMDNYGWDADRDPTVIHPSEMAKDTWCARATYLRIVSGQWPPEKEKFDFVRENIFATGNDIHAKWQDRLIDAGFPVWGDWECSLCYARITGLKPPGETMNPHCVWQGCHRWQYKEVTLNAKDTLLIAGHSDAGFDDNLVEIKSIGLGTLRMDDPALLRRHQDGGKTDLTKLWNDIRRPLKSHLIQGDVYLHLAHVLGLPFTKIVYLYEFKPNQMTKEFTVRYDAARVAPLIAKADKIRYAVEHRMPPDCIKPGKCKDCQAFPRQRRTVARTRSDLNPG